MKLNELRENIDRFSALMSNLEDLNLKHKVAIEDIQNESENLNLEVEKFIHSLEMKKNDFQGEIRKNLEDKITLIKNDVEKETANINNQLNSFIEKTKQENDSILGKIKQEYTLLESKLIKGIEMIESTRELTEALVNANSKFRSAKIIAAASLFLALIALAFSFL